MSLNLKLLPDKGYERLEPYAMKVARTVLRKGRTSNRSSLFDNIGLDESDLQDGSSHSYLADTPIV